MCKVALFYRTSFDLCMYIARTLLKVKLECLNCLLHLAPLGRHYDCILKGKANGHPKNVSHEGFTSGYSLKPCSEIPGQCLPLTTSRNPISHPYLMVSGLSASQSSSHVMYTKMWTSLTRTMTLCLHQAVRHVRGSAHRSPFASSLHLIHYSKLSMKMCLFSRRDLMYACFIF